ncbi:hypothetical protein PFISCL1PPCAC_2711, partial [Pristionchus fissidentatus]
ILQMAGENEDRDELMDDSSADDDDLMDSTDQSECEADLDLEEMDFFAANQSCAIHPHLKEDIRKALSTFREAEEELGIPAVQIDETRTNLKYITAVALTYTLKDISEHLLEIWNLEDTPAIIMELDNIHRGEFRTYLHAPTITVKKHSSEGGNFIVGEQLKNFAIKICRETFSLRSNESPAVVGSFFEELYGRVKERLTRLSEYCVTCGEKLLSGGVMPSICDRDLCMYQYSELHLFEGMSVPRVSPDVLALLLFAFGNANLSHRRRDILTPAPPIKSLADLIEEAKRKKAERTGESGDPGPFKNNDTNFGTNQGSLYRIPTATSGSGAESSTFAILLEHLPCPRSILSSVSSYHTFRREWPLMADIIDWLVITNRSYLEKVPRVMNVDFLHTESQYCFISDTPAKQAEFDQLVQQNGNKTRFFFHGSPIENWHSIIRAGLKNMSGTKYQLVGAAYGQGIYLSPFLDFAITYASRSNGRRYGSGSMTQERTCRTDCSAADCCETERLEDLACVALVEVVDCKQAYSMKTEEIFVVEQDKWCSIRMLLLYRTKDIQQLQAAVDKAYRKGERMALSDPSAYMRHGRHSGRFSMPSTSRRGGGSSSTRASQQQLQLAASVAATPPVGNPAGILKSTLASMYGAMQGFISGPSTSSSSSTTVVQQQPVVQHSQLQQPGPVPAAPPSSPQPMTREERTKEAASQMKKLMELRRKAEENKKKREEEE